MWVCREWPSQLAVVWEVGTAIGLGLRVAGVARRFCLGVGPGFVAAGARGGCHGVGGRAVLVTLGGSTGNGGGLVSIFHGVKGGSRLW